MPCLLFFLVVLIFVDNTCGCRKQFESLYIYDKYFDRQPAILIAQLNIAYNDFCVKKIWYVVIPLTPNVNYICGV